MNTVVLLSAVFCLIASFCLVSRRRWSVAAALGACLIFMLQYVFLFPELARHLRMQETLQKLEQLQAVVERDLDHPDRPIFGIDLSHCSELVYPTGSIHLFPLEHLERVDFSHSNANDRYIEHFSPKTPPFKFLNLEDTRITDEALYHMDYYRFLEELNLKDTQITDKSVQPLCSMAALRHLDLRGTRITEKGMASLQNALPNCRITWDRNAMRGEEVSEGEEKGASHEIREF